MTCHMHILLFIGFFLVSLLFAHVQQYTGLPSKYVLRDHPWHCSGNHIWCRDFTDMNFVQSKYLYLLYYLPNPKVSICYWALFFCPQMSQLSTY